MNVSPRLVPLVGVVLAGALVLPSGALAKGGGGGGGGGGATGPAPTPDAVVCDTSADGIVGPDQVIFSNQIGDAGCVTVIGNEFALSLYRLAVSPGWTAQVDSSGGTGGVRVTFTQTATRYEVSARIAPGKTEVRL
jgi:hypothetical protein